MKGWQRVVAMLLCNSIVGIAQCCPGDLYGRVTDPSGAPIQNADIKVNCKTRTGVYHLEAYTDAKGAYRTGRLPWEPCDVEITAQEFSPVRKKITPLMDSNIELNVKMQIAQARVPSAPFITPSSR